MARRSGGYEPRAPGFHRRNRGVNENDAALRPLRARQKACLRCPAWTLENNDLRGGFAPRVQTKARVASGALHLIVDSTGLKLRGAGEWLVEKHGTEKRRAWRKLHIGIDADSGEILAFDSDRQGR